MVSIINYRIAILRLHGGLKEYYDYILKNSQERIFLTDLISPSTTYFFRDDLLNEFYRIKSFLPKKIRVLVIGASTGAEAYSAAYILRTMKFSFTICATDINRSALRFAKEGKYPLILINEIEEDIRKKMFYKRKVRAKFMKNVYFKFMDVNSKKDFRGFDLIIARNVLKYFKTDIQKIFLNKVFIHDVKSNILLMLGLQEGDNKDINPLNFVKCNRIGKYSYKI